ncbi:Hsp20/alpha crystallin family protein [Salinilacihabitans rarus]|uniref:Hsp20/alpha crystallin family protein n=1 Tax=Salinilacihabitans rarus TaxID=2961596 RepID=UPI0020C88D2F|nr:Hsp20/alpha crystallin family protein [Salinilacihabitans rarus]
MVDDPPDDPPDEPTDDRRDGNWIASLLDALERLDRYSSSEHRGRGRRFDYDVSIRTGLDAIDDRRRDPEEGGPPGRRPSGTRPSAPERGSSGRTASADRYNLTTRRHGDELLVTADVAGVDPDDVTVGFDDDVLVVAVEDRPLERVDLPWEGSTAEARVNNGVLTVRARPADD